MAILWLFPLLYATVASLRSYQYTAQHGYLSFGGFTFSNYTKAWEVWRLRTRVRELSDHHHPGRGPDAVLACMVAFVISRFNTRFNQIMLALFLAGNLLPSAGTVDPRVQDVPEDRGALLDVRLGHAAELRTWASSS